MKLTKRALDTLDLEIERLWRANHAGVQIPVLDISKVFRAAQAAARPHLVLGKNITVALEEARPDIKAAMAKVVSDLGLTRSVIV